MATRWSLRGGLNDRLGETVPVRDQCRPGNPASHVPGHSLGPRPRYGERPCTPVPPTS